ncbi:hypothetical protein N7508_003549 [Penicillium antarcticum]|uniref:uncharacterized protein n=1 Tax=Penicillium antarcticum TaxID=416450 RepID=UPI00239D1F25|nr:uncharacterized protein N7508_003549 [Penicillium antarcticum]KAJ5312719.1 hypothetical protein N7508_003549 [Penicillium antarcticum]
MGKKRKRPIKDRGPPSSHPSITSPRRFRNPASSTGKTSHPVISLYYRQVVTLREYLLQQLPVTSKSRRRRILTGLRADDSASETSQTLAHLLDSTLVGVLKESSPTLNSERQKEYLSFTQTQSRSILVSTDTGPTCPQSEVVDFVIWKLFNHGSYSKPQHLLAHGFQRPAMGLNALETNIPGVVSQFPNQNVRTLKEGAWAEVLDLLGSNGDEIMMQLLFDCGVFAPINARKGIYSQLSGSPLSILEPLNDGTNLKELAKTKTNPKTPAVGARDLPKENGDHKRVSNKSVRSPNSIIFLRRRILYGRAESNARTVSGLGKTHVLNRFSTLGSAAQTVHVLKYVFPRQFGLLNAFTVDPNGPNSTDDLKSFMFRENEISSSEDQKPRRAHNECDASDGGVGNTKVPKRLRGSAIELVRKLRTRNSRCSYLELLRYYCPTDRSGPQWLGAFASNIESDTNKSEPDSSLQSNLVTQLPLGQLSSSTSSAPTLSDATSTNHTAGECSGFETEQQPAIKKPRSSLTDYATPTSSVSAFCRSVLQKLIPRQFFGVGPGGIHNLRLILRNVDRFIKLRRFESLTLHEVCKGIKISSIAWLEPPQVQTPASETKSKISLSDFNKRMELLHELTFWIFDSILIPLIRSHFYVTESQTHRNRLFYFRHDVWQKLIEKPFGDLKTAMFEELEPDRAQRVLARRPLGFGALRLLPKSTGLRPILNLRKRVIKESFWGGKRRTFLAPSINSSITPIYNMLTYERQQAPAKLGSSMGSVAEMHHRLKTFKEKLTNQLPLDLKCRKPNLPPSCFDTIPQKKLLSLIAELVSEEGYHISKHVEFQVSAQQGKPARKYIGRAAPTMKPQLLPDYYNNEPAGRKANTVFVDTIAQKDYNAEDLLALLDEHVRYNLVKIGKKYFRQRNGIPQGSVLSSILCNFFYAELEREVLNFITPENALLMRLVDDFLLITTYSNLATQFLEVMIRGQPTYGVQVNPAKSMANYSAAVDGILLPRLEGTPLFPYLGKLIDTHTLEIHRDQDRLLEGGESAAATLSNALTVESTRLPGHTFQRRMLSSFRLQLHPMYIDDGHNSRAVVLANLYSGFVTCAMKMYRYMKSLRGRAQPGLLTVSQTIHALIMQTQGLIQARRACHSGSSFSCFVQQSHIIYLAALAFRFVLKRKQTRYRDLLGWLDDKIKQARPKSDSEAFRMTQVVKKSNEKFEEWRF